MNSNNNTNDIQIILNILSNMYTNNNHTIIQYNNNNNIIDHFQNQNVHILNIIRSVVTSLITNYSNQNSNPRINPNRTNTNRTNTNRSYIHSDWDHQVTNPDINSTTQNNNEERQTLDYTIDDLGRIIVNNIPYIIDSIEQIQIPLSRLNYNSLFNTANANTRDNFFDPIDIYPSQRQIENATRVVSYCDILTPNNTSCPISLESFDDNEQVTIIRHCQHIFKTNQLNSWFIRNSRCPVCRYDIREYNNTNITNETIENTEENNSVIYNEERTSNPTSNLTRNLTSNLTSLLFRNINRFANDPSGNNFY